VYIEKIANSLDRFIAESISFEKDKILIQPVHHSMIFESGFLDLRDGLGAEDAASDCDEVLMGRAFGNQVYFEKLLEISFFRGKGFVGRVEETIVDQRMNGNRGIMLNPFANQLFDVVGWVKGLARFVR